jgi:hypothetical protein
MLLLLFVAVVTFNVSEMEALGTASKFYREVRVIFSQNVCYWPGIEPRFCRMESFGVFPPLLVYSSGENSFLFSLAALMLVTEMVVSRDMYHVLEECPAHSCHLQLP